MIRADDGGRLPGVLEAPACTELTRIEPDADARRNDQPVRCARLTPSCPPRVAVGPASSVPLPSAVANEIVPVCAAVLATMSPTVTELPVPPSTTWLARVVTAPKPSAADPSNAALAFLPSALALIPAALAWWPTATDVPCEAAPLGVTPLAVVAPGSIAVELSAPALAAGPQANAVGSLVEAPAMSTQSAALTGEQRGNRQSQPA